MTEAELAVLAGELLVVGIEGPTLDAPTARLLSAGHRAGVILFKRNLPDVETAHALCRDILRVSASPGPLLGIDQEGGRVARLGAPVLKLPPMRVLGDHGDPELVLRAAEILGTQLSAIGFNLDFAPVLDVDSNPQNPVIGDRAFSRDPRAVARLGAAFARGLESAGVISCGKHFPGHGDTDKDSHLDLPVVKHPRARLHDIELLPFREAYRDVSSLMTAHVVFEALDPGIPATHSKTIVTDLLRRDIGYEGLVFSDDLEMRALAAHHSPEDAAVRAIEAGCDVLLVCKEAEVAERAHRALVREAASSPAFLGRCQEAARRSRAARTRFPCRPARDVDAMRATLASDAAASLTRELDALTSR